MFSFASRPFFFFFFSHPNLQTPSVVKLLLYVLLYFGVPSQVPLCALFILGILFSACSHVLGSKLLHVVVAILFYLHVIITIKTAIHCFVVHNSEFIIY